MLQTTVYIETKDHYCVFDILALNCYVYFHANAQLDAFCTDRYKSYRNITQHLFVNYQMQFRKLIKLITKMVVCAAQLIFRFG